MRARFKSRHGAQSQHTPWLYWTLIPEGQMSEIIGEASGRLPEEVHLSAPEIEWRKIVGIRNILAHEYFGISLPIIWDIV